MMEGVREKSVLDIISIDTSREMTPAEVYAANVNSTVGITTSVTTNFWGFHTTSAAAAGLEENDIITAINGEEIDGTCSGGRALRLSQQCVRTHIQPEYRK